MDAVQRERVGARIRALRKERGWTQDELAEKAGVSSRTIFSVEKGAHVPQPAKLRAILDALDVAEPQDGGDLLSLEGMPEDVMIFLRVAAQRLCVLGEEERAQVLTALYPRLLAEIGRQKGDP
jgi:transcriptional regulator with XRE-family HTH domain